MLAEQCHPLLELVTVDLASRESVGQSDFGTQTLRAGTAAVVSPVKEIRYKDEDVKIGEGTIGPVTGRLYDTLTGIQYGTKEDSNGWTVRVK